MVIDHPFGTPCGARGVVQGNRLPLVHRFLPMLVCRSSADERLVVELTQALAARPLGVIDIDHPGPVLQKRQRLPNGARVFRVADHEPGFAMHQDIGDCRRIEPGVDRAQNRATHRYAEMRFDHLRRVGGNQYHRIATANARGLERR
ncbi:hypothetical protein D3C76_942720 [compost metagenome]